MNLPERERRRIQERSMQIRRKRNRALFKNAHPVLRPSRALEQPVRIRIVMEFK